jgi:VRR-NUC domain
MAAVSLGNAMPITELRTITREADYQNQIILLLRWMGYHVYHTYDSRKSEPGFPDLIALKPGKRALVLEVKTEHGRVSVDQRNWISWFRAAGIKAEIVRPSDWPEVSKWIIRDDLQTESTPSTIKAILATEITRKPALHLNRRVTG